MADAWAILHGEIRALGIAIDAHFEERARRYLGELRRWSRVSRLTGYRSEGDQVRHLLLDSLLMLAVLPDPASPLLDIGTGSGAPGLVLQLARPGWAVTLIEANRRRANFLRQVVRELALEALTVREGRAEALAEADVALAGAFRVVTMRAVASPPDAVALARPFLAPEGRLVLPVHPGTAMAHGVPRVVRLRCGGPLSRERSFLIIPADEMARGVSRGTRGPGGANPGGGESEGRGR
ncbi:MAG: 16S rRNA (guanine(527)-N(7))-methyltransferase RsmG [Candidatus Rokuibacteriota bacterium]